MRELFAENDTCHTGRADPPLALWKRINHNDGSGFASVEIVRVPSTAEYSAAVTAADSNQGDQVAYLALPTLSGEGWVKDASALLRLTITVYFSRRGDGAMIAVDGYGWATRSCCQFLSFEFGTMSAEAVLQVGNVALRNAMVALRDSFEAKRACFGKAEVPGSCTAPPYSEWRFVR